MEKTEGKTNGRQLRSARKNVLNSSKPAVNQENNSGVEPEEIKENDSALYNLNTPLQNPLIINHIFNFLEFDDLKQCHLVCTKWNQLSISFLEKMSMIIIGWPKSGYEVEEERSPKTFKEFYQNAIIDFRAFKLTSFLLHDGGWPIRSLAEFLQDQKPEMRELMIENICINGHYKRPSVFSIKNYFSISPHIGNQLTHLSIINNNGSKFVVTTKNLTSIKFITLDNCALELSANCKLSPEKFELNHVALVKKEKIVHNFLINDLLNFEKLKELTLDGDTSTRIHFRLSVTDGSSIALDLEGNTSLDSLSLKNVSLYDFEESQWQIRKLRLRRMSFKSRIQMTLTELDFGHGTIYLGLLPESLERLTLSEIECIWGVLKVICPPLFSLPNLKSLQLLTDSSECELETNVYRHDDDDSDEEPGEDDKCRDIKADDVDDNLDDKIEEEDIIYDPNENALRYLDFFDKCPNITNVMLTSKKRLCQYSSQRLHTEWIPRSTENIFLTGNIKAIGKEFNLNKLVIEDNCLDYILGTLQRLKSKHLIVDLDSEGLKQFPELEKILLEIIKMPYETLALGSLEQRMTIPDFTKSSFSNYVDEWADYYLFKNQRGVAIKEWEFRKLMEN